MFLTTVQYLVQVKAETKMWEIVEAFSECDKQGAVELTLALQAKKTNRQYRLLRVIREELIDPRGEKCC